MGAFLDKPKTEKHTRNGEGNGLRFGLSSMQGWRVEMEDAHSVRIRLPHPLLTNWSYFAVFDGHAGSRISFYCSEQLLDSIVNNLDFSSQHSVSESDAISGATMGNHSCSNDLKHEELSPGWVKAAIRTGFLSLDDTIRKLPDIINGQDRSGTTAICALISPSHIYLANCGDSRAVLSRVGKAAVTTVDHKPTCPVEKERIQNAGGSVMIQRVNGSLAVSRALGDFEYKNVTGRGQCEQLVSPEPEVLVEERQKDDEFLVLACDGIWDVMTNDELCDFVRDRLMVTDDLTAICNSVVDTCLSKGSRDNMSIIIVAFEGAPRVSEDAQRKEKLINEQIELKIKEIMKAGLPDSSMLQYVMHTLALEDIEGLPPGGGINAKRSIIEEILNRLNASEKLN